MKILPHELTWRKNPQTRIRKYLGIQTIFLVNALYFPNDFFFFKDHLTKQAIVIRKGTCDRHAKDKCKK